MNESRLPLRIPPPQSVRDRIAEALLVADSKLYAEWEQVMEWEDTMLAFANDVAYRADRYHDALQRIAENAECSIGLGATSKHGKFCAFHTAREALGA